MARYFILAVLFVQALLAAGEAPAPAAEVAAEAPSPEQQRAELVADLAALGVPTSELTGRIIPGANQVQINAALVNIINSRLTESYQRGVAAATQNAQQVLAAIANPSAVNALSPSARSQYDAVVELTQNPNFANPTVSSTTAGRRLLVA